MRTIQLRRFGPLTKWSRWSWTVVALTVLLPTIATAQEASLSEDVTFTRDVAPLIHRSCSRCHRPDQVAPMALMTYEEVRPWARSIKNRVESRVMPPWHMDRRIGIQDFKNDPSLTQTEIDTIVRWVDTGAKRGDPTDMPALPQYGSADDWQIGEPDLIVRYPTFLVPAEGPDLYGNLYTDVDLDEDRYIKAIQTKPADKKARLVVHHTNAFAIFPGEEANGGVEAEQHLVEYASGKQAEIFPDDSGMFLQAGSTTRLSYHLHSVGEDIPTVIEMGLIFHPKGTTPDHIRWTKQLAGAHGTIAGLVDLPAGQVTRSDGYTRLSKAAKITMFQPHMHMLGRYQCLELIYPTQPVRAEVVNCANFDYNWHLAYNYADDAAPIAPAGTILHVINWHDNSSAHRANPDPRNWTGSGSRTIDEMGFAWIGWYDLTDEQYEAEIAEREAAQRKTDN